MELIGRLVFSSTDEEFDWSEEDDDDAFQWTDLAKNYAARQRRRHADDDSDSDTATIGASDADAESDTETEDMCADAGALSQNITALSLFFVQHERKLVPCASP